MKVNEKRSDGSQGSSQGKRFDEVLAKTPRKPLPPRAPGGSVVRPGAKPGLGSTGKPGLPVARVIEKACLARAETVSRSTQMSVRTDARLSEGHAASADASRERGEARLLGDLRAQLVRDQEAAQPAAAASLTPPAPTPGRDSENPSTAAGEPPTAKGISEAGPAREATPTDPAERADAIMALVERIEAAVKGGEASLSLGLGEGAQASRIEVRRVGKGEVTLVIQAKGAGGRRQLEAESETLRQALAARGIRVRTLRVDTA